MLRRTSLTSARRASPLRRKKSPRKQDQPSAIEVWHTAMKLAKVNKSPRKGTAAYRKVKAIFDELWNNP